MRVLFISDVYFPRVNGVSTSVRTFRQDLAACGVETTLVVPDYGVDYEDTEHYAVTRDFLNHYPRRLQQLLEDE